MLKELMEEQNDHHHDHDCCCGHHHKHHHHDHDCECEHHHEHHHHDHDCECEHHHEHHHHDHDCECGHHHADEVFNNVGIEVAKVYDYEALNILLSNLANGKYGEVVRAKGIVKTTLGWKKFNITPNELIFEDNDPIIIGKICVIGTHLDEELMKNLF
jgi:hypothetical protein